MLREAYRYSCQQLRELRCSWLLESGVRDLIRGIGCARRRRGCRAGQRARDRRACVSEVNNNIASRTADRSTHPIPTVVTTRRSSVRGALQLYRGHRARRTPVRRELVSDVRRCHTATSPVTAIGLLNARSVRDKSTAVYDRIVADRLHLCALVETWHDAADSPQLIACTPPGYRYIEKARTRPATTSTTTLTNHGGLCLFYASAISAREVPLPSCKSDLEVLAVYVRGAGWNALVIVVYRPGSSTPTGEFFDDLADVLERAATYACPLILLGDVNVHLDVADDPHTVKWQSILDSHSLVQHVTSPTHREGHTLDVVVTRSDYPSVDVRVESPTISGHWFITTSVDLRLDHRRSADTSSPFCRHHSSTYVAQFRH